MKKHIIYAGMLLSTMALTTACDENFNDWVAPAVGQQEAAAQYNVNIVGSGIDVKMEDSAQKDTFRLATISSDHADVASISVKQVLVNGHVLPVTIQGNEVYATRAQLDSTAQAALQSRKYEMRALDVTVKSVAMLKNGTAVMVESKTTQNEQPIPTPAIDSKGYYLLGDFAGVGWNLATPLHMTKVEEGVYQAEVTTTGNTNWFKFYEASHHSATDWDEVNKGQLGVATNGDPASFNFIEWNNVQTPTIEGAGLRKRITLDVNNWTFKVESPFSELYMAGDANGWQQVDFFSTTNQVEYTGFMYLTTNGFKFCSQPNWDGINLGAGAADGTLDATGGDIKIAEAGYYKVDVNTSAMTYTLLPITTIGVIGDATPGGWESDQDMTYNTTTRAWEITGLTLTAGKIKFRANDAWDINWGGLPDALTQGGDDLAMEAGTYDIQLFAWCNGKAYCKITKQ